MSALRFVSPATFLAVLVSASLSAQSKPASDLPAAQEFPVTMRQNVVAGTAAVGTKVEAKLTAATLFNKEVIPVGAVFSGEVVESAAKSAAAPSRLAVRMDSVRWKKGSAAVRVYLTSWYYPVRLVAAGDRSEDRPTGIHGDIGAQTGAPRSSVPYSHPLPPGSTPEGSDIPPGPTSTISDHREAMKDVDSARLDDGTVVLTSVRANIKLDKSTTYVLATGVLASVPVN